MIITVPHKNSSIPKKHYQHFDKMSMGNYVEKFLEDISFIPFDAKMDKLPI
jgi:hypothetical protein